MRHALGSRGIRLAVLVPHRDSRKILRAYSGELFAGGFTGAWSFPWVAPLALLSRPLDGAELTALARALRERSLQADRGGKFRAETPSRLALRELYPDFPALPSLWGPGISLGFRAEDFGPSGSAALNRVFHRPVLACALLGPEDPPLPPPVFSFGAAAVANMVYRPLSPGGFSFAWEIGELHWLPAVRRKRS
jgi:hypothetical protein